MGNTFLTTETIAKQGVATLHEQLVMRQLIHTDLTKEFEQARPGDTVNVRKPATFVAKKFDRNKGTELQDAKEESVSVKLDQFYDVSFPVTVEDMALSIDDFDAQLLTPAMQAIANVVDQVLIAEAVEATKQSVGGENTPQGKWNDPGALVEAGRVLDTANVPPLDRAVVIGAATKASWLHSKDIKNAEKSGSTEALRRGSLGKDLSGFEVYMTTNIEAPKPAEKQQKGDPTTEVSIALHKSALAFASAPQVNMPGADSAYATYNGLSIRVTRDYDISKKQSIISVDILFGVKTLDADRICLIKGDDKAE